MRLGCHGGTVAARLSALKPKDGGPMSRSAARFFSDDKRATASRLSEWRPALKIEKRNNFGTKTHRIGDPPPSLRELR
jgi:hypothetical protein